jgi:hypothetical protein
MLDDRTVVEDREVGAFFAATAERFAIGVAQREHDPVLVDDVALEVAPPGAQHHLARSVEQEDRGAREADLLARDLDRSAQDRVRVLERDDLGERRQQRRQLPVNRAVDDFRHGQG